MGYVTVRIAGTDDTVLFPDTMSDAEIAAVLARRFPPPKPAQPKEKLDPRTHPAMRLSPLEDLRLMEGSLAVKLNELRETPDDPHLQRDVEFTRRKVEALRKRAGVQTPVAPAPPPMPPAPEPSADPKPAAGPTVRGLEEAQRERAARKERAAALRRLVQDLEEQGQPEDVIAPLRAEADAAAAEAERTGVGTAWRTGLGIAGGTLGTLGGALAGSVAGPLGVTGGGLAGSALGTGLGSYLGTKLDIAASADSISAEDAEQLLHDNVVEDVLLDTAGNALFFVGGKALRVAMTPRLREVMARVMHRRRAAQRVATAVEAATAQAKIGRAPPDAPSAAAEAVRTLGRYERDVVPTPGQITGRPSPVERVVRSMHPYAFLEAEDALRQGAEAIRRDVVGANVPQARQALGESVQTLAEVVERAVKQRTGPVFERAQRDAGTVDYRGVRDIIARELAAHERTPGGKFRSSEAALLRNMAEGLGAVEKEALAEGLGAVEKGVRADAVPFETALAFLSTNKARLRDTADATAPSGPFRKTLADIVQAASEAEDVALAGMPSSQPLREARDAYRTLMATKYGDELAKVLARPPEDVGEYFWKKGTVQEIAALNRLIKLAEAEKAVAPEAASELRAKLMRGFLAQAVPDVDAAATWSKKLGADPRLRDTWQALLATDPAVAREVNRNMRMLEEVAKIASRTNADLGLKGGSYLGNLPQRSLVGALAGFISPTYAVLVFSAEFLTGAMALAATRGDLKALRSIRAVLGAMRAGDRAIRAPAFRHAMADVIQFGLANGLLPPEDTQPQEETQQ